MFVCVCFCYQENCTCIVFRYLVFILTEIMSHLLNTVEYWRENEELRRTLHLQYTEGRWAFRVSDIPQRNVWPIGEKIIAIQRHLKKAAHRLCDLQKWHKPREKITAGKSQTPRPYVEVMGHYAYSAPCLQMSLKDLGFKNK